MTSRCGIRASSPANETEKNQTTSKESGQASELAFRRTARTAARTFQARTIELGCQGRKRGLTTSTDDGSVRPPRGPSPATTSAWSDAYRRLWRGADRGAAAPSHRLLRW